MTTETTKAHGTGEGMRLTLEKISCKIPVSRWVKLAELQLALAIPISFLEHEPSRTLERASDLWDNQVLPKIHGLIQTRKSRQMNKYMRSAVFRSGMQVTLSRFNFMTENIKVELRELDSTDSSEFGHAKYLLDFYLLSPIPDSVRYAPSCAAEIPDPVSLAQLVVEYPWQEVMSIAEVVEVNGHSLRSHTLDSSPVDPSLDPAEEIPMVEATVDSSSTQLTPYVVQASTVATTQTSARRHNTRQTPAYADNVINTSTMMLLLCCMFLIAACLPQGAMAEVISLNDASFEHQTQASTGATTGSWLVMFSIPSCESCQTLKPVLEDLSQDEALYEQGIVLGAVDCTESTEVCQRFSVTKLPTFVYLHKKQLYAFDATKKDDSNEEFPTPMLDQLKSFVLRDYASIEAMPIPNPPSIADELMEALNKLYEVGTDSPLLGMAIVTLASMLLLTVLVLVYALVRGSTSSNDTTAGSGKKKTKKN